MGTMRYKISRALADFLGHLIDKTKHHARNSKVLALKMTNITVEKKGIFNSHNAVSLFTNIPIQESLNIV